tara:strand:- start:384 stop:875 length:492 start_codon:yes stop_codon:yes gene_type:complete
LLTFQRQALIRAKKMYSLDVLDKKIVNCLIEDARKSYRQIAREIKSSVVTVMNRVKKLEAKGVITKYTVGVGYASIGYDFQALAEIRVIRGEQASVGQWLRKHPNVSAVYDHTGLFDLTAITKFKNRTELNEFVKELQGLTSVERTETKLLLRTIKEHPVYVK